MKMKNLFIALILCLPLSLFAQEAGISQRVEKYLQDHLTELSLSEVDIQDYEIYRNYVSKQSGLEHVFLQQSVDGITIHKAEIRLHWHAEKGWLQTQNTFVPNLSSIAIESAQGINAEKAIQEACKHLNIEYSKTQQVQKKDEITYLFEADFSLEAIPVKLTYFKLGNSLRKAWDLSIYEKDASDWWNVLIDANTGELLRKYNWVHHCAFEKGESCEHAIQAVPTASFAPLQTDGASYNVFALPVESPAHGDRSIVVDPHNADASPYGWHDTNAITGAEYTITRGNNVHAYLDSLDNNSPQGDEPDGGADLVFDFEYNHLLEPHANVDAATVNLFYMNNMMHDVWYHYGFDPQSGNFQQNNYGEGGYGGDYVMAEAQDGSGSNNANFATPGDGSNPRMQMYRWDRPANPYDLLTVVAPEDMAATLEAVPTADWAGEITEEALIADLALVDDGSSWGIEGCDALVNDLTGKVALISRGSCEFGMKALNAQNAGAIAAIIFNNVEGMVNMAAGAVGDQVTIPAIFINKVEGNMLRDALEGGKNVQVSIVNNLPEGPDQMDSDFDNGIIAHEYGHGISSRLTGGCLYGDEQAGEGWSDFFALVMTTDESNFAEQSHGIGTYVSSQPVDGRGIRLAPYSRDMGLNPMTYDYIITQSVPHGVGAVWASMLWDLYWDFVDVYGFDTDIYDGTGGNNMVMQLVIDGLKLQPCDANFTDMRDAIIEADYYLYDGVNECMIWETFARRGLGYSADAGSSSSRGDGQQEFDVMPECLQTLKIEKSASANAKAGDDLEYNLSVQNHTGGTIANVTVRDTLQSGISFVSATCDASVQGNILTFNLGEMNDGTSQYCMYTVTLDENLYSEVLFEDDMEGGEGNWFTWAEEGEFIWDLTSDFGSHSGNRAWFAEDVAERTEVFLEMDAFTVQGEAPTLSFWHSYITEAGFDGGYVSITTDEENWEDLGDHMIRGYYRGESQGPPPLGGKQSYWGDSNGFINTLIDLSAYQDQEVIIRFTFVTDDENPEFETVEGWLIDDVRIIDRYTVENTACVYQNDSWANCDEVEEAGTLIFDHYGVDLEESTTDIHLQLFPNPAKDLFVVRLSGEWDTDCILELRDVQGKLMMHINTDEKRIEIPVENFASGMYFLEVKDLQHQKVQKLIIQH